MSRFSEIRWIRWILEFCQNQKSWPWSYCRVTGEPWIGCQCPGNCWCSFLPSHDCLVFEVGGGMHQDRDKKPEQSIKHAARTGQREEHSQSDTLLTNMSDQNGVPRRDRFMKTAIFCSRTASPQTQYYPHAAWCYQTRQPFQDQTLSQNIQTTEIWTTISNFESQRTTRLSRSRLTDTQQPALCRTLSLIASETRRPALHVSSMSGAIGMFCVLKYCRQSWSSVCNFFSSISPASVLLWQWQVFTKISRSYSNKWHDLRSDQRLHFTFLFFKQEKKS